MAYGTITHWPSHTEYDFCDLVNDKYETGDVSKCPECGAELDSYHGIEFTDGGIQIIHHCKCGKVLTFNYFLCNVIAEDGLE